MTRRWFTAIVVLQVLAVLLGVLAWLFWSGVQVKGVMHHFTTNATDTTDTLINQGTLAPGAGVEPVDIALEYSLSGQEVFYSITSATGLFLFPLALAAINLIVMVISRVRTARR